MAKKTTKAVPRYVSNDKLPESWNRLLKLGDFRDLSAVIEEEGKPRGIPQDQYEALREIGRVDRSELGIALFSMVSILITFFLLR